MNSKIKTIVGMVIFVVLIAGASIAYNTLSKKTQPIVSSTAKTTQPEKSRAPDFAFTKQDGTQVHLSDFFGKPIVINFWASWCPPCKAELPDFQKVYDEMGASVEFIMMDLVDGQRETVAKGDRFFADSGYTLPIYFDTMQEGAYKYGVDAIPTTLFIDAEGFVVAAHRGQLNEALLRKGIALLTK